MAFIGIFVFEESSLVELICVHVCWVARDEHARLWQPDTGSVTRTNGTLPHEIARGKNSFRDRCYWEAMLRYRVCEKKMERTGDRNFLSVKIYFHHDANCLFVYVDTDYVGQGDQGQTHRCRSIARGTCLENIKKTRWINSYIVRL